MNGRGTLIAACVISLATLCLGIVASVLFAGELPTWLLALELLVCLSLALAWGFTGFFPRLSPWLKCRPVVGALLVIAGVVVVFVPPQFAVAALLIGAGCRLVWVTSCELGRTSSGDRPGTAEVVIVRQNGKPPVRRADSGEIARNPKQ